jgi:hypothetical protein
MDDPNTLVDRLSSLSLDSKKEKVTVQIQKMKQMMGQNMKKQRQISQRIVTLQSKIEYETSKGTRRNQRRKMKRSLRAIDDLTLRNMRLRESINALKKV